MKITFYLVRHGETLFNHLGRMQGSCDSPLTERGIAQAYETADQLKDIWFDRIYSSPSERAWNTADIIAKDREVQPVLLSGLHEMSFGRLDGARHTTHEEEIRRCQESLDYSSAGGESPAMMEARIRNTLRTIIDESEDGDRILLVGHGMYQICTMKFLLGIDLEALRQECDEAGRSMIPNGGIMVFTYEDGEYQIQQVPVEPKNFENKMEDKTVHLYYIRHGETLFNHFNRMQGRSDSPLTAQGIEQVKLSGKALHNIDFAFAYCSSAERARDTAVYILETHDISAIPNRDLREIDFGTYEARVRDSIMDELYERFNPRVDFSDVGGESEEMVIERIKRILKLVVARAKDGENVLLVAHGSLYMTMIKHLFNIYRADLTEEMKAKGKHIMPNGGIAKFTFSQGTYQLDQLMVTPEEFMEVK